MKLVIVPLASSDTSLDPAQLCLPAFRRLGEASRTRQVSLNEAESALRRFDGPIAALLGTFDGHGDPVPKAWAAVLNATEVWEMGTSPG